MKKFCCILMILIVMTFVPMQISAGPMSIVENPAIGIPHTTPNINGFVDGSDGWSQSLYMNYDTLGFFWHVNPLTMKGEVKFAWDNDYFYYCAVIQDGLEATHEITGDIIPAGTNEFLYSTGYDDIDLKTDGTAFGYNGDVFGLLIDPMEIFLENGFTGNEDNTPWYLIGIFEGDVAKMYREKVNAADITDRVKVAGRKTADGCCIEAGIPWDMMIEDIENISFGDCVIDKTELLSSGAMIKAATMYHDRFYDVEAEEVDTWGCFVTVPEVMADGIPGEKGTGTNVKSMGLTLYLENNASSDTGSDTTAIIDDTTLSADDTTTAVHTPEDTDHDTNVGDTSLIPEGDTSASTDNNLPSDKDSDTSAPAQSNKDTQSGSTGEGGIIADSENTEADSSASNSKNTVAGKETESGKQNGSLKDASVSNSKTTTAKTTATKNTTKKAATGKPEGGNAAQTFDIGAAVAVGMLAVSGIGIMEARKRK